MGRRPFYPNSGIAPLSSVPWENFQKCGLLDFLELVIRERSFPQNMKPLFPILFSAVFLALAYGHRSHAATFNIANGNVSALITAINTANTNNQDDTINLASNGSYVLTTVQDTGLGTTGLPVLLADYPSRTDGKITINGNGATISRSTAGGTPEFRLLRLANYGTNGSLITINNLNFTNGRLTNNGGGALYVNGYLLLNNCTVTGNVAQRGAGIENAIREITVQNCTFSANQAVSGLGGGIYNQGGELTLINSTLAGNTSTGDGDGVASVGQIAGTDTEIISCTFVNNGIANREVTHIVATRVGNTIFSNSELSSPATNSGLSTITSMGYNLSNASGNGFLTQSSDKVNIDPKFDPDGLRANGGPTQTIALVAGSPAIDAGNSFFLSADQRGFARAVNNPSVPNVSDGADIGAYEAAADPLQGGEPSFIITTLNDHNDGSCTAGDCTLREALQRTNSRPGADTITFASGLSGVLTLLPAQGGHIGLLDSTTITGPGARSLALSAQGQGYLLEVVNGTNAISGLTFRDGSVSGGAAGASNFGGAIVNAAGLSLTDCTFVNNSVRGNDGVYFTANNGGTARGGAIYNAGSMALTRCTFARTTSGNGAYGGRGATPPDDGVGRAGGTGGGGLGGAIYNEAGASLSINTCTFSGNTGFGGDGGDGTDGGLGRGRKGSETIASPDAIGGAGGMGVGAICNLGYMTVTNSTFTTNAGFGGDGGAGGFPNGGADGKGVGGIRAESGSSGFLRNTLVAANTRNQGGGPDVDGAFTSNGYNLVGIGNSSSGFTGAGDQVGTTASPLDARLSAITNNGGQTDTVALLSDSPAIDRGNAVGASTDQRNHVRPYDTPFIANLTDGSDIGAFELDNAFVYIRNIARDGNRMEITFRGTPGQRFRLEWRASLTSGSWERVFNSADTVAGSGDSYLSDPSPPSPGPAFYRVRMLTNPFE